MIRQSEGPTTSNQNGSDDRDVKLRTHKDNELWAPTGWVHVQKDIDFSDPKVNLIHTAIVKNRSNL